MNGKGGNEPFENVFFTTGQLISEFIFNTYLEFLGRPNIFNRKISTVMINSVEKGDFVIFLRIFSGFTNGHAINNNGLFLNILA